MSDIRYVCLSDTHFGARHSLLTRLNRSRREVLSENPLLDSMTACIGRVLRGVHDGDEPPTLVLNGDILELALAETRIAVAAFDQFLKRMLAPDEGLFADVVIVPGNHDHHLWEMAREDAYADRVAAEGPSGPGPGHSTKLFTRQPERPIQRLLTAVGADCCEGIRAVYPNMGLPEETNTHGRCVVFSHGHFIEPIYSFVSTAARVLFQDLQPLESIEQLEEENFAWIDFLWSALGRSGAAGLGVMGIYQSRADSRKLRKLMRHAADVIAREHLDTGLPDWIEEHMVRWGLYLLTDYLKNLERQRSRAVLSRDATDGLQEFVRLIRRQFDTERPWDEPAPELTFVFGHTHKPFTRAMHFPGFTGIGEALNTGGWVIDAPESSPRRGASAVLIDAELNAVNLRLFNEGRYRPRVEHTGDAVRLAREVTDCIGADERPWQAFGHELRKAVAANRRGRRRNG